MRSKRCQPHFFLATIGAFALAFHLSTTTPSSALAKDAPATGKAREQLKQAADLSAAFRHVAETMRRSLVSINSVKRIAISQRQSDVSSFGFAFPGREDATGQPGEDLFDDRSGDRELEVQGQGTGIIVTNDGYILTNSHVVLGADEVTVKLYDGRLYKAKTVGTDSPTEVGVLKIEATKLTPAELGESEEAAVGEWVLAMGSPFGLDQTVTAGIISAKGRSNLGIAGYEDFLQTDAAINPGNSGGPLVNLDGKVIGINTAIASRSGGSMGIGFAIPIDMARSVMQKIIKEGRVHRGWLGVALQDLDENLARSFGFQESEGLLISDVGSDSPAAKSGLRSGDILTKMNGKPIRSRNQFRNQIAASLPGTKMDFEFFRDGKHFAQTVQLAELPSKDEEAESRSPSKPPAAESNTDLGLRLRALTPEMARQLHHDQPVGLVVIGVDPSGFAAKAGVKTKDVIVSIGSQPVRTIDEFRTALRTQDLRQGVRMQVRTDGLRRYVWLKTP